MKEAVYLFGFLLSCANKNGVVRMSYRDLSNKMDVAERTLTYWMAILKREGYVVIKKSTTMIITIQKFRPIKSKKDKDTISQNLAGLAHKTSQVSAGPKNETWQPPAKPSGNSLLDPEQDLAGLNSINPDKQGTSSDSLNTSKIKSNNINKALTLDSNSDIHQLIDHCKTEFHRIHGIESPYITGAACKTLKALTASRPDAEIKTLVTQYLSLDDAALRSKGFPIEWMMTRINELLINSVEEKVRTHEEEGAWQERIRRGREAHEERMKAIA